MNGSSAPNIIPAHCDSCDGTRNSYIRASYSKNESVKNDVVDWTNSYRILECCGCAKLFVQHEFWCSEISHMERDSRTGEWDEVTTVKTTYFPPALARRLPVWIDELRGKDELLALIMHEVYDALQSNLVIVATAGARILLDRAMILLLDGDVGGFGEKLKALTGKGVIGKEDHDLLSVMINAGNAASHRGYRPTDKHLTTILDTIENLFHRKFILQPAAAGLKATTPTRRQHRPA